MLQKSLAKGSDTMSLRDIQWLLPSNGESSYIYLLPSFFFTSRSYLMFFYTEKKIQQKKNFKWVSTLVA